MPELPETEIVARRLEAVLPGQRIESVLVPGINVLKTFDPPVEALGDGEIIRVTRRGKLLLIDIETKQHGVLVLVIHLMTAGRIGLTEKHTSVRDRSARLLVRLQSGQELRIREFGSMQAAWVKLLGKETGAVEEVQAKLGPEAWPDPPPLNLVLCFSRPLNGLLRDQKVIAGIGRTWVDEILHAAKLSPFKRGDDLSDDEAEALRQAIIAELGRAINFYEEEVKLPLPAKFPKPTRIHNHQGEPCYRCSTKLEAVFYESYVMTYCPKCQTQGRVLKDRRLSRLLK